MRGNAGGLNLRYQAYHDLGFHHRVARCAGRICNVDTRYDECDIAMKYSDYAVSQSAAIIRIADDPSRSQWRFR